MYNTTSFKTQYMLHLHHATHPVMWRHRRCNSTFMYDSTYLGRYTLYQHWYDSIFHIFILNYTNRKQNNNFVLQVPYLLRQYLCHQKEDPPVFMVERNRSLEYLKAHTIKKIHQTHQRHAFLRYS